MAIDGAVYNVTQYIKFHPGGVAEIMKGAGKDATQIFNEVHRWVNYGSMLKKCLVGKLVNNGMVKAPQYGNLLAPPRAMGTNLSTVNKPQVGTQSATQVPFSRAPSKPRYDYFQNDTSIKVSIYTRIPGMGTECAVLERPDGNVKISIYLPGGKVYRLHFVPSNPLALSYSITSAKSTGKIEIDLPKVEHSLKWNKLGQYLTEHDSIVDDNSDIDYIPCTLTEVAKLTHDTGLYTVALPQGCHMIVPLGYHVNLKAEILGMEITRSYTPICKLDGFQLPSNNIYLIIKIYPDGALTQYIHSLQPGAQVLVSHPKGQFNALQLESYPSVLLLAAGTGVTPMMKLIAHCLGAGKLVHLVFFNKTPSDIIWKEDLNNLSLQKDSGLKVTHVISDADKSWDGSVGKLSSEMLANYLPIDTKSQTFVAVCGPIPFVRLCQKYLAEMNCNKEQMHIFQE
ncbi:cytochrome b5 reductase 4-like isoform X2 [Watersipora subatra]